MTFQLYLHTLQIHTNSSAEHIINADNMSNYRPISLLPSFSKIFEKVIFIRIYKHLNDNNVLAKELFGFRQHSSTEKAIYELLNKILNALNNRSMTGGIFCDLEKAFDCGNHYILLTKLKFYGMMGPAHKLITSYLHTRYQRVIINTRNKYDNTASDWKKINNGVPQGSILGPSLFLVYINDLPLFLNRISTPIIFADDTSVLITSQNPRDFNIITNEILQKLDKWFKINLLSLNFDKTHIIHFKTKNTHITEVSVKYNDKLIYSLNNIKFLGMFINDTATWSTHLDQLTNKLSSACYAVRVMKEYMPLKTLIMIYYAYFHSLMNYGLIFWGNSPYSIHIFRLQKKIIRIITSTRNRESCRSWFKRLKILSLQSQYIYSILSFVTDNMKQFTSNFTVHNKKTRQNMNLHLPSSKLTLYQKGTYHMAIIKFIIVFQHKRNSL
jgi:hypothetical protein